MNLDENGKFTVEKNPFLKSELLPLKKREAFQVGGQLYKTPEAAAKRIAWGWIFLKYGGMKNTQHPSIEDIKELHGMKCECASELEYTDEGNLYQYPSDGCPLHDRHIGYFSRLHKLATKKILSAWSL